MALWGASSAELAPLPPLRPIIGPILLNQRVEEGLSDPLRVYQRVLLLRGHRVPLQARLEEAAQDRRIVLVGIRP